MEKAIAFFKSAWNIISGLALIIAVLLTSFVIPPNISLYVAEGGVDILALSKFIISSVILIVLVPCILYKKRKHLKFWVGISLSALVISVLLYFSYINLLNKVSVYNKYAKERVIVGEHLLSVAQKAVDSIQRVDKVQVTKVYMVEALGEPHDIWNNDELQKRSTKVLYWYLITLSSFTIFLLSAIQAVYCANQKNRR